MNVFVKQFDFPVCDFCSIPEIVEDFDAPEMTAVALDADRIVDGVRYDGKWAACSGCAAMIHARDMEGLLERVKSTEDILTPNLPDDAYLGQLRMMYRAIFAVLDMKEQVKK